MIVLAELSQVNRDPCDFSTHHPMLRTLEESSGPQVSGQASPPIIYQKWSFGVNITRSHKKQITATTICFVLFLYETLKRVSVYLCICMYYENFSGKKKKKKQRPQAECARRSISFLLLFFTETGLG